MDRPSKTLNHQALVSTFFGRLVTIRAPSVAETESRRSCWLQRAAAWPTWRCNSRERYAPSGGVYVPALRSIRLLGAPPRISTIPDFTTGFFDIN
jgi:hypothetical protein